jgi:hypothetical protein
VVGHRGAFGDSGWIEPRRFFSLRHPVKPISCLTRADIVLIHSLGVEEVRHAANLKRT